ncbi:putative DNA helicase [Trypanosoma rangeli]|uniref:Putative DNA helicase n=1 Tax=Trypanosoma rangeli TaxID=5698 RepID=A0A3R7MWL4_TRYRA|nr:putative DNA helicase [Trypanosoma rangeli]RNF12431.1 putative DNA helicase [Trypanosoma rangeli]|eukprot:RNF12431.1 putative DNA helicase [Trypanosoma rangeli]
MCFICGRAREKTSWRASDNSTGHKRSMNCCCGTPVRCTISKAGTLNYTCAVSKCRFFALAPVQAEGWRRVMPPPHSTEDFGVVRFEAVLHPEKKTTHVIATVSPYELDGVTAVLEDVRFKPMWYVSKRAYLYPMELYSQVVAALRKLSTPRVQVEEIPPFFFRCLSAAQEIQLQHERNMSENLSNAADAEDVVYSQLRSFQKKGVDFIIARGGRGMIADDMGLGKTVQALAVAHHYRSEWPVLIVCPLSLVENWAKELTRFCSLPAGRIAILQNTKASVMDVHSAVIVPYSSLKSLDALSTTFQVVILDESHYVKTVDSKRTMAALKLCRAARRVLLLSGTPTLSRPIELYPQLQAIMHHAWTPTKTQFGARYCNAFVGRFGVDYTGHSNMSELHVLLQHFVIRRTKKELGDELPSKSRQLLYVYITPKEKKGLEKSVLALRNSLRDGATLPMSGAVTSTTKMHGNSSGSTAAAAGSAAPTRGLTAFDLKIATARAKIAAVQDYVKSTAEQMVESRQKVIIFAHHQCMMEAIREAVESVQPKQPLDYIYITGETPAAQREALTTHFRTSPNCHVAVLSMHSCGVGHNLTCATMVVFAELDWNPSTHLQCEDRVHRMGQSSACIIKYLLAEGTSDSVIWPMLQTKLTVTHAVLEDTKAGGEGWSAGADTRRILRSDVSPTPSSQEKRQVTLEGFLSHSVSHSSRPLTQNSEASSDVVKSSDEWTQSGTSPEAPHRSQSAMAPVERVLLDIATLRQQRESRRASPSASVLSSSAVALSPAAAVTATASTTPLAHSQRQATLHELTGNHSLTSCIALSSPPPRANAFRVSVAAITSTGCGGAVNTPSSSNNTALCSSPACYSVRTLLVSRPAAATPTLVCASVKPSGGVGTAAPSVASAARKEEVIRLAPAPRSEEIRCYNARRTLFTLGSVVEKRPRTDDSDDHTL